MDEQTKRCKTCGSEKALTEFPHNPAYRDDRQSRCKSCTSQAKTRRQRERVRTDPEYRERVAEYRRELRQRDGKGTQRSAVGIARRKIVGSPEWARAKVAMAVYRGRMEKPDACSVCGQAVPRHRLHGHHWHGDYANRPLDVRWLCSLCHADEHYGKVA